MKEKYTYDLKGPGAQRLFEQLKEAEKNMPRWHRNSQHGNYPPMNNHLEYTIGFFAGMMACVVIAMAGFIIHSLC